MARLTPEGQQMVDAIAQRYALSSDAVAQMLDAVAMGGGSMAQFNIPELGGGGQWMQGGMTMVGDMFNHGLKMTVDNLCAELSTLYYNQPFEPTPQPASGPQGGVSLFVPGSSQSNWWPQALGQPASSGSQNNMRYAYFPNFKRLAVDAGGQVALYDTLNHQIGGFSQQQSFDGSITLTSQFGVVALAELPHVILNDPLGPSYAEMAPTPDLQPEDTMEQMPEPQPDPTIGQVPEVPPTVTEPVAAVDADTIFATIEKLGGLMERGLITEQEFQDKKRELLERL
ncbi:SHOCT domain-containing protein [Magnetococcus sp. PR-3]|uniref:SHOCT domain-containing protein n=1 Tax=Magnetococcus sp. PR-3 TaxID=3120355 RepID=UPI002FCE2D45